MHLQLMHVLILLLSSLYVQSYDMPVRQWLNEPFKIDI